MGATVAAVGPPCAINLDAVCNKPGQKGTNSSARRRPHFGPSKNYAVSAPPQAEATAKEAEAIGETFPIN
jgi:hypothetical protein